MEPTTHALRALRFDRESRQLPGWHEAAGKPTIVAWNAAPFGSEAWSTLNRQWCGDNITCKSLLEGEARVT